jgi:hypothetical protein
MLASFNVSLAMLLLWMQLTPSEPYASTTRSAQGISSPMGEKQRYWVYLCQTYGHFRYLHYYRESMELLDRNLSIATAIASSVSIGSWAIWKDLGWLWGIFIAASQVIGAIKGFLPFARRAELLRDVSTAYANLATLIEGEWFKVKSSSDKDINARLLKFQTEQDRIEEKLFSKVSLPKRKDLLAQAAEDTLIHLKRFYGQ